jgi:hypothetical protein
VKSKETAESESAEDRKQTKQVWSAPVMSIFGTVEDITRGCDKGFGKTDGVAYTSSRLQCAS